MSCRWMRFTLLIYSFLWCLSTISTAHADLPNNGYYRGKLILRTQSTLDEKPVTAQIQENNDADNGGILIDLKNIDGSSIEEEAVTLDDPLSVTLPKLSQDQISLDQDNTVTDQDCFQTSDPDLLRVCYDTASVFIEASDSKGVVFSLTLNSSKLPSPSVTPTPSEVPQNYTLSDAVKYAMNNSFQSKGEFERVMQASLLAKNARLNLLPHLSIGSILAITKGAADPQGLIGAIGDLLPFLLPTRWIKAKNAQLQSKAEQLASLSMQGDVGLELESLAYLFDEDSNALNAFTDAVNEANHLIAQIHTLEVLGQYPVGTSDTIKTNMESMQLDQNALLSAWVEEKAALSQAMGFLHPDAVLSIQVPQDSNAPITDTEAMIEQDVVNKAPELKQMDEVISIGKNSKTASYFEWLDPSGNTNAGIGFGLGSYVQATNHQVAELQVQRNSLEATLRSKVNVAFGQYQVALNRMQIAQEDNQLQITRSTRVKELILFGKDVSTLDLVTVVQDRLKAQLELLNTQSSLRVLRAKLDRLRLQGFYSSLIN